VLCSGSVPSGSDTTFHVTVLPYGNAEEDLVVTPTSHVFVGLCIQSSVGSAGSKRYAT
jgi:hypothetical protein